MIKLACWFSGSHVLPLSLHTVFYNWDDNSHQQEKWSRKWQHWSLVQMPKTTFAYPTRTSTRHHDSWLPGANVWLSWCCHGATDPWGEKGFGWVDGLTQWVTLTRADNLSYLVFLPRVDSGFSKSWLKSSSKSKSCLHQNQSSCWQEVSVWTVQKETQITTLINRSLNCSGRRSALECKNKFVSETCNAY